MIEKEQTNGTTSFLSLGDILIVTMKTGSDLFPHPYFCPAPKSFGNASFLESKDDKRKLLNLCCLRMLHESGAMTFFPPFATEVLRTYDISYGPTKK